MSRQSEPGTRKPQIDRAGEKIVAEKSEKISHRGKVGREEGEGGFLIGAREKTQTRGAAWRKRQRVPLKER